MNNLYYHSPPLSQPTDEIPHFGGLRKYHLFIPIRLQKVSFEGVF